MYKINWTDELKATVREMLIAHEDEVLGVRTIDTLYNVGDDMDYSYDWFANEYGDDDEDEDEEPAMLDGACAIYIPTNTYCVSSPEQVDKALAEAMDIIERAYNSYEGRHAYLVTGSYSDWGDDKDEIIVHSPVVAAKII